jgi:hypothetical protein
MNRLSAFGKRRTFGGLPVAGLVGVIAVVAGCGGPKVTSGPTFLDMVEYDHYFFDDPATTKSSVKVHPDVIKAEIERLAAPSWQIARANILAAGKDAIPILIANADRPEPTHVSLRPAPGHSMPEARATWTLGQVTCSVLGDMVGNYGSFDGTRLPSANKAAWEQWWRANRKKIAVYTEEGTVPAHVRKQKKKVVAATAERYPSLDSDMSKMLKKRAARQRAKLKALRASELKQLEQRRKAQAK